MHRIAVISDTHGRLREEVSGQAGTCEAILHAGDIDSMEVAQALKKIAPLYVVRGNTDGEWAADIRRNCILNYMDLIFIWYTTKSI